MPDGRGKIFRIAGAHSCLAAKLDALAQMGPGVGDTSVVDAESGEVIEEGVRIVSEEIGSNASETNIVGCESTIEEISPSDVPDPRLTALLDAARRGSPRRPASFRLRLAFFAQRA